MVRAGQRGRRCARHIRSVANGLRFEVAFEKIKFEVFSPLVGRFNVFNILAACGAAMTCQLPPEVIARGIETCKGVPGRFEKWMKVSLFW